MLAFVVFVFACSRDVTNERATTAPTLMSPTQATEFDGAMELQLPHGFLALCGAACENSEAPLTKQLTTNLFAILHGELGPAAPIEQVATFLECSTMQQRCDEPVNLDQLEHAFWLWLGAPGAVIDDEPSGDLAQRSLSNLTGVERSPAGCAVPCGATTFDFLNIVSALAERGYLGGLGGAPPVSAGPLWTLPNWRIGECNDSTGESRWGWYDYAFERNELCVNSDLPADHQRDVALHELGHMWQRSLGMAVIDTIETDADCFASLHGADFTNYVPQGCIDSEHRQQVQAAILAAATGGLD